MSNKINHSEGHSRSHASSANTRGNQASASHPPIADHWLVSAPKSTQSENNSSNCKGLEYTGLTLLRLHAWMQQPLNR